MEDSAMIFQSVGSNYSLKMALSALIMRGSYRDETELVKWLEHRYGGTATVYSKGRNALSSAVDAVTPANQQPRVAVNALTCSVVVDAITSLDGVITYLDVKKTGHFDARKLMAALKSSQPPKIVIVQNTYGHPCDIAPIEALCVKYGCVLIEDLAHSIGQRYPDGREVGTVGDITMLSFGRDKIIDAVNGGALVVREPKYLAAIERPTKQRSRREQARDRIYPLTTWLTRLLYPVGLGKLIHVGTSKLRLVRRSSDGGIHRNQKLPQWQAKWIRTQLTHLDDTIAARRRIVEVYRKALSKKILADNATIRAPFISTRRQALFDALASSGYHLSDTWYDTPIGPARKYRSIDYPETECRRAVAAAQLIVNFPTHRLVTEADAKKIATIAGDYL